MNNNTMLVGGIVALVLIGGLVVYGMSNKSSPPQTATSTAPVVNNTGGQTETITPSAPIVTTSTLVVSSNSMAVVTGKVIPGGAQTIYWYEHGKTSALGARTASQAIGGGYASISAPAIISGLSANTTYYYRLGAQNAYGTMTGQTYSFSTNSNPPIVGVGPTTRTDAASSVARSSANMNGSVTPNNYETSYWFEYGETAEFGNTTSVQSAGSGNTTRSVNSALSNLKPLTKYYFRLNAQNQFGTMTGGTNSFTTLGPVSAQSPVVTTTSAGNVATSSATLRGRLNQNGAQASYWFEYSADSLLGNILGSSTRTQLSGNGAATISVSADIKNLIPDTKYFYQLVATSVQGTVRGDIVSFTTKKN